MRWRIRAPNLRLPMLAKELSEMAKRRRTYSVRAAFAILLFVLSAITFVPEYQASQTLPLGLFGQGGKLLDALYEVEWFGLSLFIPAIVGGAIAGEKERQTFDLLLLTRLGPWTILFEKLLSRFVLIATFLLVSLPLLFIAYLLGGVGAEDVSFASLGLLLSAFEVASISLFCSAFCATSTSAIAMSYLLSGIVYIAPYLFILVIIAVDRYVTQMGGSQLAIVSWGNEHGYTVVTLANSTLGLDLFMVPPSFGRSFGRVFHTDLSSYLGLAAVGGIFLLLARFVIIRRASPQPKHHVRRLFRWLDSKFQRINDRVGGGIVFGRTRHDLPGDWPIAWREKRRGNLGRVHYLIRILLVVEIPLVILATLASFTGYGLVHGINFLLWTIAILIVIVRASGMIAAENTRRTLDVLLTTPLPLSALVNDKLRSLWRVIFIVAVPIVINTFFITWMEATTYAGRPSRIPFSESQRSLVLSTELGPYLDAVFTIASLFIVLQLAAQIAFYCGLVAKTQGRAVTTALAVFVGWSTIPVIVHFFTWRAGHLTLLFSPVWYPLVMEVPNLVEPGGLFSWKDKDTYRGLLFLLTDGLMVAVVVFLNRRKAKTVLLRTVSMSTKSPSCPPIPGLPLSFQGANPQSADKLN